MDYIFNDQHTGGLKWKEQITQALMTRVSQDLRRSCKGRTLQFHVHGSSELPGKLFGSLLFSDPPTSWWSCYKFCLSWDNFSSIPLRCQTSRSRTGGWPELWEGINGVNKSSSKWPETRVRGTGSMSHTPTRIVTSTDLIPPGTGSLSSRQNRTWQEWAGLDVSWRIKTGLKGTEQLGMTRFGSVLGHFLGLP